MSDEQSVIPLAIPVVGAAEARNLQSCIDQNFVSSVGPFVSQFEEMVALNTGATAAVATCAGTAGLHAALVAIGVGHGDLVVLPTFTFIASANAISHCGATPWLMDVCEDSWNMDLAQLRREFQNNARRDGSRLVHKPTGRRIAAIMPVYCLGTPIDFDQLNLFSQEWNVPVVVDAAAAIGMRWNDQPLAHAGSLSVISFNGNKTLTSGGGGMVVGRDPELMALVRHLTTTARVGTDYTHDRVGFNYRMTNLQAAVGCAQMERLDELLAAKKRIRENYASAFAEYDIMRGFPDPDGQSTCWLSGLVFESPDAPSVADFSDQLRKRKVEARPFWKPMHLQPPYASSAPRAASLQRSDDLWQRVLTLPCSTNLTDQQQRRVIQTIGEILDQKPLK